MNWFTRLFSNKAIEAPIEAVITQAAGPIAGPIVGGLLDAYVNKNANGLQFTDSQKKWIGFINEKATSEKPVENGVDIKLIKLPMTLQGRGDDMIISYLTPQFEDKAYITGSVAFMIDWEGSWCFYVGYRSPDVSTEALSTMWMKLLGETNAALA